MTEPLDQRISRWLDGLEHLVAWWGEHGLGIILVLAAITIGLPLLALIILAVLDHILPNRWGRR